MSDLKNELFVARLQGIAQTAADEIVGVTGEDEGDAVSSLRRFDPRGAEPASTLYELLKAAESAHGGQDVELSQRLLRFCRVVERMH